MKATAAYDAGFTGKGVAIAIVDTGIDRSNPEFAGRISADSRAFETKIARCMTCAPETITFDLQDVLGHGTATASVAAGAKDGKGMQGVAPDANILALKISTADLDGVTADSVIKEGSGVNTYAIAPAISYAVQKGAFVISMSLNGTANGDALVADLRAAMDAVRMNERLVVQSVSNFTNDDSYKGQIAEAMVGGDMANRDWFLFGIRVDAQLRAPSANGVPGALEDRTLSVVADYVDVAQIGGGTAKETGNSFAAPAIAGAAALLKQRWPQLGGKVIGRILLDTARDLGAAGPDQTFGVGLLDMENAMRAQAPAASFAAAQQVLGRFSSLTLSAPFGGAAAASTLGAKIGSMTVFDRYGRDYRMSAPTGIRVRGSGLLAGAMLAPGVGTWSQPDIDRRLGFGDKGVGPWQGVTPRPPAFVSFSPTPGQSVSFGAGVQVGHGAGISGSPLRAVVSTPLGISSAWAGSGWSASFADGSSRGGRTQLRTVAFATPLGLGVEIGGLQERGTALGLSTGVDLGVRGARTSIFAFTAHRSMLGVELAARAMTATTRVNGTSEMLRFDAPLRSSAFSLSAGRPALGGIMTLGASSPLRVLRAPASVMVPVAYDLMTNALASRLERVNLVPRARELDVEIGWAAALSVTSTLRVGIAHAFDAGHVAGATDDAGFVALVLR